MTGRDSIRRNFGRRGGQDFNNKKNGGQKASTKNTLEGFTFYVSSTKKARNYKNTALFLINHIKKDFNRGNNITEALQKLEYKNTENCNPVLKASTLYDDDAKARQYKQFKIPFRADYVEAQKRKM